MIEVKIASKTEYETCLEIRRKVFVEEQKVPLDLEVEHENECISFIALLDTIPVGTIRIRNVNGSWKVERLAVLREFRKHGVASKLIHQVLKYCKSKPLKSIYMNAQYYLRDYYKKFGFIEHGSPFEEAGIKHVKMSLE